MTNMTDDELRYKIKNSGLDYKWLAEAAGFSDVDSLRRFIRESNRGISEARKRGLIEALGESYCPKAKKTKKTKVSTTSSSRPEADAIMAYVKRERGYKNLNDTVLVMARFFHHIAITQGLDNMNLEPYEEDVEREAAND